MRVDPPRSLLTARFREPRHVIGIIYETGSIYLTSKPGMTSVPGTVIQGCIQDISSSSQQLFPDEGRATIGSLSFTAVDLSGAISEAIRDQLLNFDRGIRDSEVRVFTGDSDDFNQLVRVETYVIDEAVELDQGLYSFACSDRNRQLREEVFQQVGTRLTATLNTTDTTVHVQSTGGFNMVAHTAAFEDAPSATVGYIRIRKTGEVIRYTGKTPTTFTGCVRERFRTIADKVVVDVGTDADKLPEVEEFIYLQMPGPQLAYAVMTGQILGTSDTLPDTWNLGIDPASVDTNAFTNIGADLFDPTDHAKGLVLSFPWLQQTDGKRFIEEQINRVILCFSPVDTLGRLSLKRQTALVSKANPVATVSYDDIIMHGAIRHVQASVINEVVFEWNFDGKEYTRTDVLFNTNSIATWGRGKRVSMELGGMNASQHGRATLQHIFDSYTDRYGSPPIEVHVQLSSRFNNLELGDCIRVELPRLPDFTDSATLTRVFEVQSRQINWVTGDVSFDLFASTVRVIPENKGGTTTNLPDGWFSSEGTPLESVLTMVGDHVVAAGALTGAADLRNAVFYHVGDVIIDPGVTVTISDNVQIRCTGELQVLGKIDGKGRGIAPTADPNVVGTPLVYVNDTVQTTGSTNASAGIKYDISAGRWYAFTSPFLTGPAAVTRFDLIVDGGVLTNIPAELRGTQGIFAYGVLDGPTGADTVRALGGAGGAGGAGLMVASRGLSFGVAGIIDLSGADGNGPGAPVTLRGKSVYGGAGGGGCSGTMLVVLDGDQITFPDLTAFVGNHGATPFLGNPIQFAPPDNPAEPWRGGVYEGLGFADNSDACAMVQYTSRDVTLGDTDDEVLPAPADLAAVGDGNGLVLSWKPPAPEKYDYIEIYEATSNDRTGAIRIAQVVGDHYSKTSGTSITRWYWVRAVKTGLGHSAWDRSGVNDGVVATFGGATGADTVFYYIKPTDGTALHNGAGTLTVEAHKLTGGVDLHLNSGTIKLYVGATAVTFANGYGVGSDGYTGVFDAGDIGGDVVVELKDGPGGTVLDTITLVDLTDGASADSAVYGYVEASGPLAWTRASDQVTWTPSATTNDLAVTFRKGGADVARVARRVTRDSLGFLTASTVAHPGGDLNTSRVTVTILGSGTKSLTVKYDYANGADLASVAEGVLTSAAGADGTDGLPGSDSGGMIQNWSFEVGNLTPGWATSGGQAVLINDPAKAHTGSWSVHVGTGSTGIRVAPQYRPSVLVGQVVVATCYAARDSGSLPDANGEFFIRWEDNSGTLIATSAVVSVDRTLSGYQGLRLEATVPLGATYAMLCFSKSGGVSGQWYVDDFTFSLKGDAGNAGPDLVVTSNITRAGNVFTKTGGVDGVFDASFRSVLGYDFCSASWKAGTTNKRMAVGFNTDPAGDDAETSIDFAIEMTESGTVAVKESGAPITIPSTSYTTSSEFAMEYDGLTLKYKVDGVVIRQRTISGARLYLDSSLYHTGAQINSLAFTTIGGNFAIADEIRDDFGYVLTADLLRAYEDNQYAGELTMLTGLSDSPAGTAVRVGNNSGNDQRWLSKKVLMPYDGVSLYEVGIIVRRNAGSGLLYMGLEGIANDGVTRLNRTGVDTFGSQHYFAASGLLPGASWTVYRGYTKGWNASPTCDNTNNATSPGQMRTNVAFVRPAFLVNYAGLAGQYDVAAIWVRRLNGALNAKDTVGTPEIDPNAATDYGEFYDAAGVTYSTFS